MWAWACVCLCCSDSLGFGEGRRTHVTCTRRGRHRLLLLTQLVAIATVSKRQPAGGAGSQTSSEHGHRSVQLALYRRQHTSVYKTQYNTMGTWCTLVKAKFHYASWFGAGSEPASVMEFGFYKTLSTDVLHN